MKQDAINEWGSVVALSYIAAQRVFPDYNDMADNKAMLESIARNFGYQYGVKKQVRVNTISQSPTRTTAGSGVKGFDGIEHLVLAGIGHLIRSTRSILIEVNKSFLTQSNSLNELLISQHFNLTSEFEILAENLEGQMFNQIWTKS